MSVRLNVVMEIPGKDPREFEYEFDQERIQLGRDEHNDIQVPLSTVSRSHAVIFKEGAEWFIEDLKSTHGTKHNGKVLGQGGKKLLREADTIEIVHFKISFHTQDKLTDDYSAEHTEALARKMVEEVLASIGTEELPYVRVMNGPDEGRKYELGPDKTEVVIGRGTDCDFQINDANISRNHAKIKRDWTDITIEDLGSKNGVVINDKKIGKPASLRDADEILLGAVRLVFIDPSAKFLGKLDEIPAFAHDDTNREEPASGEEPKEAEAEKPADDGPSVPEPITDDEKPPPGTAAEVPPSAPAKEDPVAADEKPEGTSLSGTSGTAVRVKKGLGAVEIGLIAAAGVAVLALLVGVVILVAG